MAPSAIEQAGSLLDGVREHRQRHRQGRLGGGGHWRLLGVGACGSAGHRPERIRHAGIGPIGAAECLALRHSTDPGLPRMPGCGVALLPDSPDRAPLPSFGQLNQPDAARRRRPSNPWEVLRT